MNKKRLLSVSVAAALVASLGWGGTALAAPGLTQASAQTAALMALAEKPSASMAAALDASPTGVGGWALDALKGGEVLESSGDWVHFKSSTANGNATTGSTPAMAVYDSDFDFSKAGAIHATLKSPQEGTSNRFGFYLGYTNPNSGLFIGYDAGGWFWQKYDGATNEWYKGTRLAAPTATVEHDVSISWTDAKVATLNVDGQKAFDVDFSTMTNLTTKVAMKAGTYSTTLTDMYIKDFPEVDTATYRVSGTVVDSAGAPITGATVSAAGATATTDSNGSFVIDGLSSGSVTLSVSKVGFDDLTQEVTIAGSDVTLSQKLVLVASTPVETETLASDQMEVQVKKNFPAVMQYTMTKLDGKVMYGQPKDVRTVAINGTSVNLADADVSFKKINATTARYVLNVKDDAKHIDAQLSVDVSVEKNTLSLDITKIVNNADEKSYPIQTVNFPNLSLISVQSNQESAQFSGARMSSDTNRNGDTNIAITRGTTIADAGDYVYGFVSGDSLSAGLWSNSEHDGTAVAAVAGGAKNTRVVASTQNVGAETSLGLSSAPWYYHRVVTDSKGKKYTVKETDMPHMKVAIAGDANEDGTVNWEDGAIAYRDIMNNPYKYEEVPDLVAWRIAMNFGSQAQNPFLTTLDNVKKVALNTDGLGQSVLLKGYANEGHDSGHPDYQDIGQRIGGAADMNTLMKEGKDYGARFGIHINASEMYPEAKAFNDDLVRRNAAGGLQYGWNWLDQAVGIDGVYDLTHGRSDRLAALKDEVGDNLDFIYLDVWGNNTSGAEDSWETRKISQEVNENGWRMSNEWGTANEYDATFQHWAADLTYGGSGMKGQNSQVMRFLRNHQKDSWDGDYPSYGGAANAPLLGGYSMKDFEGWQGRNDYAAYINNLYTHDVTTKFLQHFKVTQWVNSPLDSTSASNAGINNGNEQITLKDDSGNIVVLSRGSNNSAQAAYRQRTITLNGKVIAAGAVAPGNGAAGGDESYLVPWTWDSQTGKALDASAQKLYHWNTNGGTTSWALPKGWENLSTVKVYKLSDQGKSDEQTVAVSGGKIELSADAKTPYVVYQGAQKQMNVAWSSGMHVVDAGFNGGQNSLKENWTVSGSGTAEVEGTNNAMLRLVDEVKVSQKLSDLKPGKRYAIYVGVDNRSSESAGISVTANGKVLAANSTDRSIAKNYVKAYGHNTNSNTQDGSSYFQNMYVWFTAPESGEVKVTLSHDGACSTGEYAYFDDVRVLENAYTSMTAESDGTLKSLSNDFEHNAQGIWPFVVSGIEGVEDNRTHLSELHEPYTQAGWDVKKMDDVLDGTWSVKTNGLTQRNSLVYQTIPQNVKFEPGETYKVSFNYQSGSDGIYGIATGEGEYNPDATQVSTLKKAMGSNADGHAEFTLTGGASGDSWFGIYSTATAPDLQGSTGSAQDFGGYKDFILDDLKIEHVESEQHTKADAQAKLKEVQGAYDSKKATYSSEGLKVYSTTIADARVLLDKDGATAADYTKAYNLLVSLDAYMKSLPGNDSSSAYDVDKDAYEVSVGSEQPQTGSEGPKEFAQDGDESTYWHTAWAEDAVEEGTGTGTGWYQFSLKEPTTIDGLRYLPRPGGAKVNGKIEKFIIVVADSTGKQTQVVTDGTFSTTTKWQKVSWDPIENVTDVAILATQTTGQTDAQANKFVSAAELRLTTPREVDAPEVAVCKANLQAALESAKALKSSDYTEATWKALEEAAAKAEEAFSNESASLYDVGLTTENLKSALAGLEPAESKPTDPTNPGGSGGEGNNTGGNTGVSPVGPSKPGPNQPTETAKTRDTASLSKTGTAVVGIIVAAVVALTIGGVAFFVARRKQRS